MKNFLVKAAFEGKGLLAGTSRIFWAAAHEQAASGKEQAIRAGGEPEGSGATCSL